jgi:hypothetical protein
MAERQRRGPVKKLLKYVSQFTDPKFNPERRGALQMIAAAPLAPKMKLLQGNLPAGLDPVQFYRGLLTKGLDIADEWTLDPKLLREAFLNELPDSDLKGVWDEYGQGGPGFMEDAYGDSYAQAVEDWHERFANNEYDISGFTPDQVEKLDKARAAFDRLNSEDVVDFDAADEEFSASLDDFLGTIDKRDMVADYGGDDLFSGYMNAIRGENMENYVADEAARLGIEPDDLMKRLGVEDFLKKAPKIGSATGYEGTGEDGFIDIEAIPEYYYQDPEALRYASLRDMLEHPVLTPNQMLEITHGEIGPALGKLSAKDIAATLQHDMVVPRTDWIDNKLQYFDHPLLDKLDMDRMSPDVRNEFVNMVDAYKSSYPQEQRIADRVRKVLAEREPMLQRAEDLPSFIGNRTSPLRVSYDSALRGKKRVQGPLDYRDVIQALPTEEY